MYDTTDARCTLCVTFRHVISCNRQDDQAWNVQITSGYVYLLVPMALFNRSIVDLPACSPPVPVLPSTGGHLPALRYAQHPEPHPAVQQVGHHRPRRRQDVIAATTRL